MPYKSLDIHDLGSLLFFSVFLVIFCYSPACSLLSAYRTVDATISLCLDCLFLCFKLILAVLSIFSSSITSLGSLPYNSSPQVVLSFLLVQGGSRAPAHSQGLVWDILRSHWRPCAVQNVFRPSRSFPWGEGKQSHGLDRKTWWCRYIWKTMLCFESQLTSHFPVCMLL